MTADEKRNEFKKDLANLLSKYRATLNVHQVFGDYDDIVVEFSYDLSLGVIREINYGKYIDCDT